MVRTRGPGRPPAPTAVAIALFLVAAFAPEGRSGEPPSPETFFGRPLAADGHLYHWDEVAGYWRALARSTPRVRVEEIGKTTEGRPFLRAVIGGERNLERLDAVLEDARRIADPRGLAPEELDRIVERAPLVLGISFQMHSTEAAGSIFGMRLAHLLATSEEEPWRTARRDVVTFAFPCTNPDGLDAVVSWYRRVAGTPFEDAALPDLYQRYAGHDNNRDWFLLGLQETRLVSGEIYQRFRPQVWWDVHQQGRSRERLFVPPFRDPLNPNLDPAVIAAIDLLGTHALFDLTRWGYRGVSTGVTYDMWWNGGNRNVPVRHNIVGLLTEAASVRLASPLFLAPQEVRAPRGLGALAPSNRMPAPWNGGWWRLADIVDYETAFARSLFAALSEHRPLLLRTVAEAALRAVRLGRDGAPAAFVLPAPFADPDALERLVSALLLTGVEVARAREAFESDGRSVPAGSIVLDLAQPYGRHVRDLFEVQRYPEGEPPYDVAGWTLPPLLGLDSAALGTPPPADLLEPVRLPDEALAGACALPRPLGGLPPTDTTVWRRLFRDLAAGHTWRFAHRGEQAALFPPEASPPPRTEAQALRLPRVALLRPWRGDKDEGWARYLLEHTGVPYRSVRPEAVRAGRLETDFDVLVLPGTSPRFLDRGREPHTAPPEMTGGLDPEGTVAIERFVRAGGTLVCLGASSSWANEVFDLGLSDATRAPEGKEFSCPGSVLRARPAEGTPFTAGLGPDVFLFFGRDSAWDLPEKDGRGARLEALLRYASPRPLYSGWIRKPETIAGRAAWVRAEVGRGAIHLFAFRPQFRSWSQRAWQLVLRALVLR